MVEAYNYIFKVSIGDFQCCCLVKNHMSAADIVCFWLFCIEIVSAIICIQVCHTGSNMHMVIILCQDVCTFVYNNIENMVIIYKMMHKTMFRGVLQRENDVFYVILT